MVIFLSKSVKKATSKISLKAISCKEVMVSGSRGFAAGAPFAAIGRLPCAAVSMILIWSVFEFGKPFPAPSTETGAAEIMEDTQERPRMAIKDAEGAVLYDDHIFSI